MGSVGTWLLVALGGAVGTTFRFGLGRLAVRLAPEAAWPVGTLGANVLGSLLLGLLFVLGEGKTLAGVDLRLVLGTGMMGGFTTYSSFNLEVLRMFTEGESLRAGLYLTATMVTCLAAGAGGLALGRLLS